MPYMGDITIYGNATDTQTHTHRQLKRGETQAMPLGDLSVFLTVAQYFVDLCGLSTYAVSTYTDSTVI